MQFRRRMPHLVCLVCLLGTALLGGLFPALHAYILHPPQASPPGVEKPARTLLTVWVLNDPWGASVWLKAQCRAFSAQHAAVHVWLRSVTQEDLALWRDSPQSGPDLLIFPAGESVDTTLLSAPQALCCSGYALVEKSAQAPATAAPRSVFGVTPSPDPAASPPPQQIVWPASLAVDNAFGVLALSAMEGPYGAAVYDAQALCSRFLAGEVEAALLDVSQLRRCTAQGAALTLLGASPATDQVLLCACGQSAAAQALQAHLLSKPAQQALGSAALFSVREDVCLYGTDTPILCAIERALRGGWRADARWAQQKRETLATAQALYGAGRSARGLLE